MTLGSWGPSVLVRGRREGQSQRDRRCCTAGDRDEGEGATRQGHGASRSCREGTKWGKPIRKGRHCVTPITTFRSPGNSGHGERPGLREPRVGGARGLSGSDTCEGHGRGGRTTSYIWQSPRNVATAVRTTDCRGHVECRHPAPRSTDGPGAGAWGWHREEGGRDRVPAGPQWHSRTQRLSPPQRVNGFKTVVSAVPHEPQTPASPPESVPSASPLKPRREERQIGSHGVSRWDQPQHSRGPSCRN